MFGLPKFGDGIGLHRVRDFMRQEGVDAGWTGPRSLAVTGSNGKGSTARMCAALLEAEGLRAGCFTSPHMFDARERFRIGDELITQAEFDRLLARALAYNASRPAGDRIGGFEALFLVALLWCREKDVDAVVWEAGIGGRYDPVRAVEARVGALTSVELEHTQILGATEELIAYDKLDAVAPGGLVIVSPATPHHLRQRLVAFAGLGQKSLFFPGDAFEVSGFAYSSSGTTFELASRRGQESVAPMQIGLAGRHQVDNALTALALARAFIAGSADEQMLRAQPSDPERAALAGVRWPGRLERVAQDPDLWIDVGHTPHAIELVTAAFAEMTPRDRTLVVFGVSSGKEVHAIARAAAARFDRFVLTQANKAGADPSSFSTAFSGKQMTVEPDLVAATSMAKAIAKAEGLAVLAIGGLYLAAEVETAWQGGDPRALAFF